MSRLVNLVGQKFGRLTVVGIHPERKRYGKGGHAVMVLWDTVCTCGEKRVVFGSNLRRGLTRSCGCFNREQTIKRSTKHGHARRGSHTSIYDRWVCMRSRCRNPNNKSYPDYGGRGIGIDPSWEPFITYFGDVGHPPEGKSLNRVNNDGDYEKSNVEWATARQQVHNRRPPKKRKRSSVGDIRAFADALTRAGMGAQS